VKKPLGVGWAEMGCWWVGLLGCAGRGGEEGGAGLRPKNRERVRVYLFFSLFQNLFSNLYSKSFAVFKTI
jgi:hypothetical protein